MLSEESMASQSVRIEHDLLGNKEVPAGAYYDSTGTTRVGRWVLNHSFMRPGLVVMGVSLAVGFGIVRLLYRS